MMPADRLAVFGLYVPHVKLLADRLTGAEDLGEDRFPAHLDAQAIQRGTDTARAAFALDLVATRTVGPGAEENLPAALGVPLECQELAIRRQLLRVEAVRRRGGDFRQRLIRDLGSAAQRILEFDDVSPALGAGIDLDEEPIHARRRASRAPSLDGPRADALPLARERACC